MVICEGPDGGGKTTLLRHLQKHFPHIKTHARASTSEGGPVAQLDRWCVTDLNSWAHAPHPMLYDRHPFISEFIYGPILRGHVKDRLDAPELLPLREQFDRQALLVLCLPPFRTVVRNVHGEAAQMPGVEQHITNIYTMYQNLLMVKEPARNIVWYDYTVHTTEYLEQIIQHHVNTWTTTKGTHV